MMNRVIIVGPIEDIISIENPNALPFGRILIKSGPDRVSSGHFVKFVNRVWVRVPSAIWHSVRDRLYVGGMVEVLGQIQGVVLDADSTYFNHGIGADRINLVEAA